MNHLNHRNMKLQGKNKLFSHSINDIVAFKMKLKQFISQLENEDMNQFLYLKIGCAADNGNLRKCSNESSCYKTHSKVAFVIMLKKTKFWHLCIHPFSLTEQKIKEKPSNIKMELIALKTIQN